MIVPDEQAALHETERGEVKLGDFVADGKYFTGTISNERKAFCFLQFQTRMDGKFMLMVRKRRLSMEIMVSWQ